MLWPSNPTLYVAEWLKRRIETRCQLSKGTASHFGVWLVYSRRLLEVTQRVALDLAEPAKTLTPVESGRKIVPGYGAEFLGQTLGGALGQTFTRFELILYDDKSTD